MIQIQRKQQIKEASIHSQYQIIATLYVGDLDFTRKETFTYDTPETLNEALKQFAIARQFNSWQTQDLGVSRRAFYDATEEIAGDDWPYCGQYDCAYVIDSMSVQEIAVDGSIWEIDVHVVVEE